MEKVLCVCVGNISRSPMMQAVLQQHLGSAFLVESAGVSKDLADRPANARSVACMKERGIDLSGHRSRWIGELDLDQYRWIVCVGSDEADQVRSILGAASANVLIANEQHDGIPDPYELGQAGYRDCVELLDRVMHASKALGRSWLPVPAFSDRRRAWSANCTAARQAVTVARSAPARRYSRQRGVTRASADTALNAAR